MKHKRFASGVLAALQILGGLPMVVLPVGLLFATISGRTFFLELLAVGLAYLLICPLLWGASWVAFRKGRVALPIILSAVPALPTLAVIGYLVAGIAIPLANVVTGHNPDGEIAAKAYTQGIVASELAYASLNQGSFGDPTCLKEPRLCLGPAYHGPFSVAFFGVPPAYPGYRLAFHPGRVTSSPRSFATFAFTAFPSAPGKNRSFCADDRARLCVFPDGAEPRVVDGHCADPCQQEGGLIQPFPIADVASGPGRRGHRRRSPMDLQPTLLDGVPITVLTTVMLPVRH